MVELQIIVRGKEPDERNIIMRSLLAGLPLKYKVLTVEVHDDGDEEKSAIIKLESERRD